MPPDLSTVTLKMSLLLLPLEILRDILELAVVDLGCRRATKLRQVNSECLDAIFHTPFAAHVVRVI